MGGEYITHIMEHVTEELRNRETKKRENKRTEEQRN
jgi:hypothetical protein